tara:strand:+ start:984 stop:1916 length:933 start_codon:yes stop_codon:yes gene_type:complete
MKTIKIVIILLISFLYHINSYGYLIEIKVKVKDQIITNIDIENEINYLIFLNPKLKNLEIKKVNRIAKDSLITEIIKRNELENFINFEEKSNLVNIIEKKLYMKKNIKDKNEFKKILRDKNLDYEKIKEKLYIEAIWNQYIYNKYSKNLIIDKDDLKKKIKNQLKKTEKKYEYNLSEIFFREEIDIDNKNKISEIYKSINNIGFENTANIYSISNSAKNGGLIGWINELQISKIINENLIKLRVDEISEPIKIGNAYIIIKLNDKKELTNNIDINKELEKLINSERNRQLNNFSIIFYKRLKKNIEINEY